MTPPAARSLLLPRSRINCGTGSFSLDMTTPIQTVFSLSVKDVTGANPITPQYTADGNWYDLTISMSRPFMFRAYPVFVVISMMLISTVQVW